MTPKEKCNELIEQFSVVVYPYFGSSMLTNDTYPSVILANAKICAILVATEVLNVALRYNDTQSEFKYWTNVREEIHKL